MAQVESIEVNEAIDQAIEVAEQMLSIDEAEALFIGQMKVPQISTLDELMFQFNGNKSAVMRYLSKEKKMSTAAIAKMMGVRYQFVRNVLTAPTKTK